MARIAGQRIAFLVGNEGVEESELSKPWEAVLRSGAFPTLVAPQPGVVQTFQRFDRSAQWNVDITVGQAGSADFDAVVLPGGVASADSLRTDRGAIQFVKSAFAFGRPCAAIDHGVWLLIDAGLVAHRKLTCWPSIKTDVRNAGGDWVDAESVVCRNGPNVLLSSRAPDDLYAFCAALLSLLEEQAGAEQPELELTGVWGRSGRLAASTW